MHLNIRKIYFIQVLVCTHLHSQDKSCDQADSMKTPVSV